MRLKSSFATSVWDRTRPPASNGCAWSMPNNGSCGPRIPRTSRAWSINHPEMRKSGLLSRFLRLTRHMRGVGWLRCSCAIVWVEWNMIPSGAACSGYQKRYVLRYKSACFGALGNRWSCSARFFWHGLDGWERLIRLLPRRTASQVARPVRNSKSMALSSAGARPADSEWAALQANLNGVWMRARLR